MSGRTARERLAHAAFQLFDERGYEGTTVDEIAERAGVGRTTFFRHYRAKEDVIFPDHDLLLERIASRLATSRTDTALTAVSEAVRLVLLHYVDEGEVARRRYRLTSSVPTLRDREIASVARYQRLFKEFLARWMGDAPGAALRAELMAACVVSAHNHVLRRWLRGEAADPMAEVDTALREVLGLFSRRTGEEETHVVAFTSRHPLDHLLPALRRLATTGQPVPGQPTQKEEDQA
ncbi:TetR family transcriptional regulator [Streptomyces sp. NPDC004959]|uniref:TetR/AcrR family transcriptional regulator n=1 Tax=Streptomyces sp. NPDC004959 TaxID=3154673 RepID=UPI0033B2E71F